ncbi:Tyrosyl-DNA phosphodiesterase [Lachnellula occidentalis]|uniref:Tyrosyl-DNA phosphodiesterase n=1 Tax=Lachnellula occidentalis TaxID=215460 RepID=A0A8H8RVW5_9HELO|nr:Tyrosyl-DNA phosphodiesterase [Lachnellula occidentalis]
MAKDLERALTASRSGQADQAEEDREFQEAIRLSKMENGATSHTPFEDQLRERTARMKRKAQEEVRHSVKRSHSGWTAVNTSSYSSSDPTSLAKSTLSPPSAAPSKLTITYPNGALRITRTPGRGNTKNCVNLTDLIHAKHLISACIFSYFIGDNELYEHLPLSKSSNAVPIYIGRDANQDPMVKEACSEVGISFDKSLSKKQLQSITSNLREMYRRMHGNNYHAFYAWSSASSHSKILVLVYPGFLRIVITSCNMMNIDTILGDNHYYIHDLPKLSSQATTEPSSFETGLLAHLQALSTPDIFLDSIRGMYDYSSVKVHLVTSVPAVCGGLKAENHGLLRLRRVIRDLDLNLPGKESGALRLEVCAASIGNLSAKWLCNFNDCALGKELIEVAGEDSVVPDLKLFYPSVRDVKEAHESAQDAASNIGCHARPWDKVPVEIKNIFHHYESKDTGRLFHQKFILAYNPQDTNAHPYYVYIGSANFSQSAWGALENDKNAVNNATCRTKIVKLNNFECGVVIPGSLVEGLLEPGTESWQSGIVPYVQTGKRYDLPKDKPWNGTLDFYINFLSYFMGSWSWEQSSRTIFRGLGTASTTDSAVLLNVRWTKNYQENQQDNSWLKFQGIGDVD